MYKKLYEVLKQKHITRYKLAKLAGIDYTNLYSALAGTRPMFPGWRKRISETLGIPESELFSDYEVSDTKWITDRLPSESTTVKAWAKMPEPYMEDKDND